MEHNDSNDKTLDEGAEAAPQSETFEVPADYRLEPELQAPLPRAVPDSLRRHARRVARQANTRKVSLVMLLLSVVSFVFRDAHLFHLAGLYFTPFAHLGWVSTIVGALSLWGLSGFWHPWTKDPFVYLREGIPVVGQVVDLRLEVTTRVNGADSAFAFDVYFQFLHPNTGELSICVLRSKEFSEGQAQLKCRVGDYLTALYLPGTLESITLYGFTGVDPDKDLVEMKGATEVAIPLLICLSGLFAIFWAFCSYTLAAAPTSLWLALLAGLLGGGWLGVRQISLSRRRQEREQLEALQAGLPIVGETHRRIAPFWGAVLGGLLGGVAWFGLMVGLNGALDRSNPKVQPVNVQDTIVTTYQALFNSYKIKYLDPNTGDTQEMGISPLDLMIEGDLKAELLTYDGALGWPWQRMRISSLTAEKQPR